MNQSLIFLNCETNGGKYINFKTMLLKLRFPYKITKYYEEQKKNEVFLFFSENNLNPKNTN